MERANIISFLSGHVSAPRLNHCLGVEKIALSLAERFGVTTDQVTPAALLHDLCREYNRDLLLQLAGNFGIVIDSIEQAEPLLLHGAVGAQLARRELEITAADVLEAISNHITGAPNLSSLARLIFICDFIEPGRNFEAARNLREQAFRLSPEELLLRVYNYTITYVINRGYLVHPHSVAGRNELIMKGVRVTDKQWSN